MATQLAWFRKRNVLTHAVLIAITIATLGPLVWIITLSFKSQQEFGVRPFGLPQRIDFSNYIDVLGDERMLGFISNSVITTFAASVIVLAGSILCGYALARVSFKGAKLLFALFIVSDSIPLFVVLVPLFILISRMGLSGTRWSIILPYAAMSMGISVFILRGFFRSISTDMEDAARVDGANTVQMIWHIMLPLVRPGIIVVIILNFISFWNEFLIASVILPGQALFTLPAGLASFFMGRYQTSWPLMAAAILISITPTLAIFAIAQEKLIEGWTVVVK